MKKRVILLLLGCIFSASFLGYSMLPLTNSPLQDKPVLDVLHTLSKAAIPDKRHAMTLLKAREAVTWQRLGFGYQNPGNVELVSNLPSMADATIQYSEKYASLYFSFPTAGACIAEQAFNKKFLDIPRNPHRIWSWHTSPNLSSFDGYVLVGGVHRRVLASFRDNCLSTFNITERT